MDWRRRFLQKSKLYVILDKSRAVNEDLAELASQTLEAGADIIQLRYKTEDIDEFLETAGNISRLVRDFKGKLFIINDRVDLARQLDCDGVHVGIGDTPVPEARRLLGPDKLIGFSVHDWNELNISEAQKPDYIGIGPAFKTPFKSSFEGLGPEETAMLYKKSNIISFAIGGIDQSSINLLTARGINRVAVLRAVSEADNPYNATLKLKKILEEREILAHN